MPVTVVQGERDTFGGADEVRGALPDGWFAEPGRALVTVSGAGHDLVPAKKVMSRDGAMAIVVSAALSLVADVAPGRF